MPDVTSSVLLWLFVLNLGIAFGAGLYEHRIVVTRWISFSPTSGGHWDPAAARLDDPGRRFWGFVSTGPLTLLAVANVFAAWHASGPARGWWLAAAITALADRAFTFSFFIPTMIHLFAMLDSTRAVALAKRWWTLNFVRHAIVLTAWLLALRAFSLLYR